MKNRHNVVTPTAIHLKDWWAILVRVFHRVMDDNVGLLSAGIAFYAFLSIFPALAAALMIWGLFTDVTALSSQLQALRELAPDEAEALILNGVAGQQFFADAPAHVVLTARFARSQWKYRENSKVYRVIQIEAGHIAQNLYLSATHRGLGAYITAAINEVELEEAFGIDAMEEGPLAVCGFGWRASERTTVELDPAGKVWPA